MFYTIYKTTNLVNGKYYIGKHQTTDLNDGYTGSGHLIKRAIRKYGPENFVTDILFVFDEEWKMNLVEKILVVPDVETNYNLCPGGKGGFGYINQNRDHAEHNRRINAKRDYSLMNKDAISLSAKNPSSRKKTVQTRKMRGTEVVPDWNGRKHKEDTKLKMSLSGRGSKNSQYGTCWITNGLENKKIPLNSLDEWISQGYRRGRV